MAGCLFEHNLRETVWLRLTQTVPKAMKRSPTKIALPPLPQHPEHGLKVEKGDRVEIRKAQISTRDLSKADAASERPIPIAVPSWAADYQSGATFRLADRLGSMRINFDNDAVRIPESGQSLEVALRDASVDPVSAAYRIAEQTLDVIAADSFLVTELIDPLREHGSWSREGGITTLRYVTTSRLATEMTVEAVVTTAEGEIRSQTQPTRQWHPSHAYFRRSQATNHLHEAYRNLFLALEALLSTAYPWSRGVGESAWLAAALQHVCEGYGIDLSSHLSVQGRNPYKQFLREQYNARRCALFHAKLSEGPALPGDLSSRAELLEATRLLGRLYLDLSRRIAGARFGGGALSYEAFSGMMNGIADMRFYISEREDFDLSASVTAPVELELRAMGNPGLHRLTGRWATATLPKGTLRRAGGIKGEDGESSEALWSQVEINTTGVDSFEFIVQMELVNAKNLREWFM